MSENKEKNCCERGTLKNDFFEENEKKTCPDMVEGFQGKKVRVLINQDWEQVCLFWLSRRLV